MPTTPLSVPGEKLTQVANAVTQVKVGFFGRGPEASKSFLNDNLLVVVMRGGFLDLEEALLSKGRADKVRDLRLTWQEEYEPEIVGSVEEILGLKVVDYHSQVLVETRIVVELFLLADA